MKRKKKNELPSLFFGCDEAMAAWANEVVGDDVDFIQRKYAIAEELENKAKTHRGQAKIRLRERFRTMTDREAADQLGMARQTVNDVRNEAERKN